MNKPRLLDLFCGAGGAARGYQEAGFYVVGVDHVPQPRYVGEEFILADALEYAAEHGHEYDAIHASPPCQAYSIMRNLPWLRDKEYPRLIEPTRHTLESSGIPWVIENVMGAQRKANMQANWLCGLMFGLRFYRHRVFETPFFWMQPGHPSHRQRIRLGRSLGGRARDIVFPLPDGSSLANTLSHAPKRVASAARTEMGVEWMTQEELSQAIPPAYTRYIGEQLMRELATRATESGV